MAQIILEPNEVFEHYHPIDSTTLLRHGYAKFICDGFERTMQVNESVFIPANKAHKFINIGAANCVLDCQHGTGTIIEG